MDRKLLQHLQIPLQPPNSATLRDNTTWFPPPLGWLKVNPDGVAKGNLGNSSGGSSIRDELGQPMATSATYFGKVSYHRAKSLAILRASSSTFIPDSTKQFAFALRDPDNSSVVYLLAAERLSERSSRDANCLVRAIKSELVVAQIGPSSLDNDFMAMYWLQAALANQSLFLFLETSQKNGHCSKLVAGSKGSSGQNGPNETSQCSETYEGSTPLSGDMAAASALIHPNRLKLAGPADTPALRALSLSMALPLQKARNPVKKERRNPRDGNFYKLPHDEKCHILFAQALRQQTQKFNMVIVIVDASSLAGIRHYWNTPLSSQVTNLVDKCFISDILKSNIEEDSSKSGSMYVEKLRTATLAMGKIFSPGKFLAPIAKGVIPGKLSFAYKVHIPVTIKAAAGKIRATTHC
ncbi:hypothetical protein KI387_007248, partial [Taxus chinensis]